MKLVKISQIDWLKKIKEDYNYYSKELNEYFYQLVEEEIYDKYADEEIIEFVADSVGLEPYYSEDLRDWCIVMDVKFRGVPDWDKVLDLASKRAGVPREAIEEYCDERFVDELWWDQVRLFKEDLESYLGEEIVVVGRSGGYWGFKYSPDMLEVNKRAVADLTRKTLSDKGFLEDALRFLDEDADKYEIIDQITYNAGEVLDDENIVDCLLVSRSFENIAKRFVSEVQKGIKEFEKPDMWVDLIVDNEWWVKE